ncbi:MAG TPA: DUF5818 domain-containing protein [Thermoanaerobaculia bacterium]|nr:DUF5818 domain-containing protein [Thermoanaerobaculia bacterium]
MRTVSGVLAAILLTACSAANGVPDEPAISLSRSTAGPGDSITVTATGFPPNSEVVVGAGPPQSEYDVLRRVRTDRQGSVEATVAVPQYAAGQRALVFVVATPDARTKVVSDRVMIQSDSTVTITGTVTDEGVECPAVRTDDNQLYTIATRDRSRLQPGTRVRITGTVAEMSFCQQGTTISATSIEVLPGG